MGQTIILSDYIVECAVTLKVKFEVQILCRPFYIQTLTSCSATAPINLQYQSKL